MSKIFIHGGGPYHPFGAQVAWFRGRLEPQGHELIYSEERSIFENLDSCDLLLIMSLDWSGAPQQKRDFWEHPERCPAEYEPLTPAHVSAIGAYIHSGRPLFCHHCAIANWDDRPEPSEWFDGRWIWGRSTHTPVGETVDVTVTAADHPVCRGIAAFSLPDELYYQLDAPQRSRVLLEAEHAGFRWPLAWAGNTPGGGKFLYSGLGHDMASFASPHLQRFLIQSFDWLLTKQ